MVHPAPGHPDGTLVNALLYHCRSLAGGGHPLRPGIVHRLDKDTSGLMVVALTDAAHRAIWRRSSRTGAWVGLPGPELGALAPSARAL